MVGFMCEKWDSSRGVIGKSCKRHVLRLWFRDSMGTKR
jgi:hypothetical protein